LDINTLFQLGSNLHQQGQLAQAKQIYEQVLAQNPAHFDALHLLGVIAGQSGHPDIAYQLISRALTVDPEHPIAWNNLGNVFKEAGRLDESLKCHDRALALMPEYAEAMSNRGVVLRLLGRAQEALESHDRALQINPNYVPAYNNRGNALQDLKRWEDALESFDQALRFWPEYAEAHANRGNALLELRRLNEALASCDRAIQINPDYAPAHNGRGNVLVELGRADAALASYDRAIRLQPNDGLAHWNKSLTHLALGQYDKGWPLYEWRWKKGDGFAPAHAFTQPLWLGKDNLQGKTILLHAEQGLGTQIQFARYVSLVKALGARVVLEAPLPLLNLLRTLQDVDELVEQGKPLPAFDFQCPLVSLPLAFQTRLDTIPASAPYLGVDPIKRQHWATKLGAKTRPRIGIAWSSTSAYEADAKRSMALQTFWACLDPNRFDVVCLQKEIKPSDQAFLDSLGDQVRFFGPELNEFSDTAALASHMDLVISTCTSVPHLTAALGIPTWILLSHVPDWRWMLKGDTSPWYDAVKLYRQDASMTWEPVLRQVSDDLKHLKI
jgi:tetratricopeptide (TPR) repeat protein